MRGAGHARARAQEEPLTASVVDRSAAHATPTLLAVRDWLLVALAFSAGIYDAISFLSFGKVFTAAQTGNFALLGLGVAGTGRGLGRCQ